MKLPPARVFEKCGALASPHDYHLNRFLFEYFPRGSGFDEVPAIDIPADLPRAEVKAFSIDDVTTTEIDDAFSVTPLANGNTQVGIHIAAPALGVPTGSPVDAIARGRLSTVYFPGRKITMLPEPAIAAFTLGKGGDCPALSLYAELSADGTIVATHSRCENVPIAANLHHGELDEVFNADALAAGGSRMNMALSSNSCGNSRRGCRRRAARLTPRATSAPNTIFTSKATGCKSSSANAARRSTRSCLS